MKRARIYASVNELSTTIEKAAVGRGFDRATGQWLAAATLACLPHHPALAWALAALAADPAPVQLTSSAQGWRCLNGAILVAGPVLRDLQAAGEALDAARFDHFDVPQLWQHSPTAPDSPSLGPFDVPADQWQALTDLAAKTYVPATEASRQRGAG